MVRWVVGSILHGVDPLSYFSCRKGGRKEGYKEGWKEGRVEGRKGGYKWVHIKEPLLLIDKSILCGGSGFLFSLSE